MPGERGSERYLHRLPVAKLPDHDHVRVLAQHGAEGSGEAQSRLAMDLHHVWLTGLAIVDKPKALRGIDAILARHAAPAKLREVARREAPLEPGLPPGAAAA